MTAVAQTVRRAPAKPPEPLRRAPARRAAAAMPQYMMAGTVPIGALHDPEEHQAEKAATAVAAGGTAHTVLDSGARHDYPKLDTVRRSCGEACPCEDCRKGVRDNATLRRAPDGTVAPVQPPNGAELAAAAGGRPMPPTLRATMENRFGADFGAVRLHTGEGAAQLSSRIGARAFAYGGDVFFGRNQFRPESTDGVHLIAHELTHTIQQGAAPRTAASTPAATPARRSPEPKLQRFSLPSFDPLGFVAEQANMLPGFRMLTLVIGFNPVNMQRVEWSVANVLRAVIEFIPGGGLITKALDQYGIIDKAANWLNEQVATLGITADSIKTALTRFIKSVDITDFASPGDVWERAKRIFNDPIDRIKTFARNVADGVIKFVKDAVLRPLAELAAQTRAWDLLIAVLGKNPITGDPVPQTPETLIGGFMKLAGQEEIWDNLKKANGVARAMAWFQQSKAALLAFVAEFPGVFLATLKSFVITDLLDLPGALGKIRTGFGDFAARFFSWAGIAAWDLLEIIFDVVSPGALAYIKKTGAALKSILKNPLPFVGNLVKAAKLGLSTFADNIGTHLKAGLIDWLTGSLPGVYIPTALSLVELGKFALSVLGITWGQIRAKIVKALGPKGETIMAALETTFDVVVALVRGGPAAAWELIKEKLTNLKDQVISGIIGLVTDTIVKKAIPKLVSMFIPGAGFISAILSIYDTVMVFVEKLSKIAAVVKSFVDSIVAIAAGQIGGAAARVEGALANLLSLAISFLAGFVGLGKVSDKIMGVIGKVRDAIDKGLDVAITWLVGRAKALFGSLFGKDGKAGQSAQKPASGPDSLHRPRISVRFQLATESHELILDPKQDDDLGVEMASASPLPFESKQRAAYNAVEYFKQYMSKIESAQIRREFDTKILPGIKDFQVSNIDAWKSIYRAKFPGKDSSAAPISDAEARARAEDVKNQAEAKLSALKAWGATSGIPDLAEKAVDDTLQMKGQAIWKEAWEKRKKQVQQALAGITYKGVRLDYRGSLSVGYKGPQKNQVRFNPGDFDVDLYVVHPADYDQAESRGAKPVGGQIFPNNPFAPRELRQVSAAARAALTAAIPDVEKLAGTDVTLRREPKR